MVAMKRYTVTCRRVDNWWAISVPELKGVHTQARRLDQVEDMARDAIALMLDVPISSIHIDVKPEVPDEVAKARRAREELRAAEEAANEATEKAARWLVGHGYTVRDAGKLLELSPQRVSQITADRGQRAA
jgi:predicted RNase H-like HicB family nuclease